MTSLLKDTAKDIDIYLDSDEDENIIRFDVKMNDDSKKERQIYASRQAPISILFYTDTQDALDVQSKFPLDLRDAFDNWPRFWRNNLYDDKDDAEGEATDWQFDDTLGSFYHPANSEYQHGVVCPDVYRSERYLIEATISTTSRSTSNDIFGMVLAHKYENGVNHVLTLMMMGDTGDTWTPDALPSLRSSDRFAIVYTAEDGNTSVHSIEDNMNPSIFAASDYAIDDWNDWDEWPHIRVKIQREADIIGCWGKKPVHLKSSNDDDDERTSTRNSALDADYEDDSFISIDLRDYDETERFRGDDSRWGFFHHSNESGVWLDVRFDNIVNTEKIETLDTVWVYDEDDGWVEADDGERLLLELNVGQRVFNPDNNKTYFVSGEGELTDEDTGEKFYYLEDAEPDDD